jgi:O-antigen/teichoic acid export membrane protein
MFLKDKSLVKNLSIVLGGVGIAQLIPFLFSFFIARIYSPEQFGIFGLLLSITGPLSVIVCLRYESTIVLPKEEKEAIGLIQLCWLIAFILSLSSVLLLFVFSALSYDVSLFYFVIPSFILFVALGQSVNFWLQRKELFKKIAFLKIIQTSTLSIFTVFFGYLSFKNGLIWGYILGWLLVSILSFSIIFSHITSLRNTFSETMQLMKKYKHFPLYNALPALLQACCVSVPLWIAKKNFTTEDVGYFNLSRQLLLILTSIGIPAFTQVYYQRSVSTFHNKLKQIIEFKKILLFLFSISVSAVIVLVLFGEEIFTLFYGNKWTISGRISSVLIFSSSLQLIVFPLSSVLNTLGKIKIVGYWQTLYFISLLSLYFIEFKNFDTFINVYILLESVILIAYFILIYYFVVQHDKTIDEEILN